MINYKDAAYHAVEANHPDALREAVASFAPLDFYEDREEWKERGGFDEPPMVVCVASSLLGSKRVPGGSTL